MQRIANLLAVKDGEVLLLKKPRRNWYVAPGGKMEVGESIYDSALREFHEETNVQANSAHLKGVFTMIIKRDEEIVDEWMLYTFVTKDFEGEAFHETREGILNWHPIDALETLPMAEGDRTNLLFAAKEKGIQYGTFEYTEDFELIKETIQCSVEY